MAITGGSISYFNPHKMSSKRNGNNKVSTLNQLISTFHSVVKKILQVNSGQEFKSTQVQQHSFTKHLILKSIGKLI